MGTAERKHHEALQRRQSILSAARRVFRLKGYAGATIAEIAQAAELATGTLYLYFTGKDALYIELLTQGYELLEDRLRAQVSQEDDARVVAGGLIDVFFDFAAEYPEYFDIIFFVLQRESARPYRDNFPAEQIERLDRWRSVCQQAAAAVFDRVDSILPQAQLPLVETIWAMLAGVVFYFASTDSFAPMAAQAKELLLKAVFGPEDVVDP